MDSICLCWAPENFGHGAPRQGLCYRDCGPGCFDQGVARLDPGAVRVRSLVFGWHLAIRGLDVRSR